MEMYVAYPGVIEALRKSRGITYAWIKKESGVSEDTIGDMRRGRPVRETSIRPVAECFDVPLECLGRPALLSRSDPYRYTFLGLYADQGEEKPDDVALQDFQLHKAGLNNPISYLWSPADGSEISARVLPEDNDRLLRISFHNRARFPGNVAIHPTCLTVRPKCDSQVYLTFMVRIPNEKDQRLTGVDLARVRTQKNLLPTNADSGSGEEAIKETLISVRITDGQLEQWEYKDRVRRLLPPVEPVDGPGWKAFVVDLKVNPANLNWEKFGTAPTVASEMPEFGVITSLVFEVGRGDPGERPGPGDGVVDIKRIHLTADRDFLKDAVEVENSKRGDEPE